MKKRFLIKAIWIIIIVLCLIIIWIVVTNYSHNKCSKIQISIEAPSDAVFISEQDVMNHLTHLNESIIGTEISKINIEKIENIINEDPFVLSSKVYATIKGIVKIEIKQRTPIVRVQNIYNNCYYISEDGYLMPLIEGKTTRVLIANGFIYNIYVKSLKLDVDSSKTSPDSIRIDKNLLKIYQTALFIHNDLFLQPLIQQLFLNKNGDILLVPLIGDLIINLGDENRIAEKFKNLRILIRKPEFISRWDEYDTININFKDQVVCSQKNNLK